MVGIKGSQSPSDLYDAEEGLRGQTDGQPEAESGTTGEIGQLRDQEPKPGTTPPSAKSGKPTLRVRLSSALFNSPHSKRNWFVIGGFGGLGIAGAALIVILFLLAGYLKIPNLIGDVTEYQFGRLARQLADHSDRVSEQALTIEGSAEITTPDKQNLRTLIQDKFEKAGNIVEKGKTTLRENTWGKLDNIRPGIIAKNLKANGDLSFNTDIVGFSDVKANPLIAPYLGETVLKSVTLKGTTYNIDSAALTPSDLLHPLRFAGKISGWTKFKSSVDFTADFAPALRDSLGQEGFGFIRSTLVANVIRRQLGIGLVGWVIGEFRGKTPAQARDIAEQDALKAVQQGEEPPSGDVPTLDDAEKKAVEATAQDATTEEGIKAIEQGGGVSQTAEKIISSAASENIFSKLVGFANPVYGLALPACLIYEGSLDSGGPSITQNTTDQVRAFYKAAAVADQIKSGSPITASTSATVSSVAGNTWQGALTSLGMATAAAAPGAQDSGTASNWQAENLAIGAWNDKFGDITQSNPYIRASGGTVHTSSTALSVESGGDQQYTLIDATPGLGGNAVGDTIKGIASGFPANAPADQKTTPGACPVLSNIWFGVGGAVVIQALSFLLDVFTGGLATEGEVATEAGTEAGIKIVTEVTVENLGARFSAAFAKNFASKVVLSKLRATITDLPRTFIGLSALTIMAKLFVNWRAGIYNNGLEQGADLANEVESGSIIAASQQGQLSFGRPLTCTEQEQSNAVNQAIIAEQNQRKGFANRYLALDNPDSLLVHAAIMVHAQTSSIFTSPIASLLSLGSGALSFGNSIGRLIGTTQAATPCADQNYGNVEYGWSEAEEGIIDSSDSYLPLQNQQTLDQSGLEDEIIQKYAPCFGYSYDSSGATLDPSDPDSRLQVDILGDGSIGTLLSTGEIVRTPDGDIVSNQGLCSPQNLGNINPAYGDLVFRTRLALSYDLSIHDLTNLQTVTN